ncbi:MAG: hypothetical protein ACYTBP_16475 [Planctomycetota bacterium]|jgi:hypothetical protein
MNRRQFIKKSGLGALSIGLSGTIAAQTASAREEKKKIQWSISRKEWKSLGVLDLIPQLDQGQQWANQSLIKYGTVEPPNQGSGGRSMRSACMPAEACAHYYAMTGDAVTLKALKSAVETFRQYRHKARARRVPYHGLDKPLMIEYDSKPEDKPTIEYQMISCHVGRNMRGMRAAAHILQDQKLLREVAEELNWWIDNPAGFNREKHFFVARIFLNEDDEDEQTLSLGKRYIMNMGGSLACSMWLVGNDLGDQRLKDYAEDQILNGIAPYQLPNGYFPYNIKHKYELIDDIAISSNYYHALTLQVLSPLLAYDFWRKQPKYVEMISRGAKYIREKLTMETGQVKHPGRMDVLRWNKKRFFPHFPKSMGITADSSLIHTRLYKYLGNNDAFAQAAKNLRWMHWNAPACVPFLTTDYTMGMHHQISEWGFSHSFRQVVLTACEGMHLKQKGARDVEAVFIR